MQSPVSLVTGGAGFMGSHVAKNCLRLGHSVVVLDDLSGGFRQNVPEDVHFVEGSITDDETVQKLFNDHRFTYVYHLAAYAAEGLSHFIRRFNYTNNLIGSMNLINAAIRSESVQRFVFTSSIAVYGKNQLPMDEEMLPVPEDPYGIAKLAVEHDLRAASHMFGLKFTIFRPHNVYGEGQNISDRYRNVIGIFMNQIMNQESMSIFGDGTQTRAFSHIDDVAPILAECVNNERSENEVFNIGADDPCRVLDLATVVSEAFGAIPSIQFLPARNEVQHAYASHEKLNRIFGKRDTIPLREGIQRMASWAKSIGPRKTSPFPAIEVKKNLPPSWQE